MFTPFEIEAKEKAPEGVPVEVLEGSVGQDAVLRRFKEGDTWRAVARFSLAEHQDDASDPRWYKIAAYDSIAEEVATHVRKGAKLHVDGFFYDGTFTNKEGKEVVFKEFRVLALKSLPVTREGRGE